MFNKYYTADLKTVDGSDLVEASITCMLPRGADSIEALRIMRNELNRANLKNHKMYNIRRIK